MEGYREILNIKIEDDEPLSSNIMWAKKSPKTTNLRVAWIQTYAEAIVL